VSAPKIIISYFFSTDAIPLGFACADAFSDLGFDVKTFHSQDEHPFWPFIKHFNKILKIIFRKHIDLTRGTQFNNQVYRENKLKNLISNFNPDILLVIRGNNYSQKALKSIKADHPKLKTIGWWVKDPRSDSQMVDDSKLYDHYFCMHKYGYNPKDDNIMHLPALGVYDQLYKPIHVSSNKNLTTDICFVGGFAKRRKEYIERITYLELEIYGPGWKKGKNSFDRRLRGVIKGSSIWGNDLVKLYNKSKIVLSIASWNPEELGGQNLRLFDVPACGAFLLTDFSEEITEFYRIGVDIETFRDPEELYDKVKYYLKYPDKRDRIAKNGYEQTLKLPNYRDKMMNIINHIGG
jgi:spore maturation protein CgeB